MRIKVTLHARSRPVQSAFSLVEVCISVAILAVMIVSLYGGMGSSFGVIQSARENLRATQIMLERVEGLRLYNWNQLVYSNMVPTWFTNHYYPWLRPASREAVRTSGRCKSARPGCTRPPPIAGTCGPST